MKRCPTCHRTFIEEHLSFCTDDGTPLVTDEVRSSYDPAATIFSTPKPETSGGEPASSPPPTQAYRVDEVPGGWPQPHSWAEPEYRPPQAPPPVASWNAPPAQQWSPPPPGAPYLPGRAPQTNPLAIASMAFGIFSVTLGMLCFGFLTAPIAIGLGVVALMQMKSNPNSTGKGMAIVGLVTGGISLGLAFLFLLISIAAR